MEALYLLIGLLIGGGAMYFVNRGELRRLREQVTLVTNLLNERLGYRPVKVAEDVAEEPSPDTPEFYTQEITKLERKVNSFDDEMPDLLERQNASKALSEAITKRQELVERQVMQNSSKPFLIEDS